MYAMTIPLVMMVVVIAYLPIVGWSIAFFNYIIGVPLFDTEFVGLRYFRQFLLHTHGQGQVDMVRIILILPLRCASC